MSVGIGVEITGTEALSHLLTDVEKRGGNLAPVFRGPVDRLVTQMELMQFSTGGRFGGRPWAPLRPATLAQKARIHRAGMGTLRRFNTLWASLVKSGGPMGVRAITATSYTRGTADAKAGFHQLGRGHNPVRQVIPDPLPLHVTNTIERLVRDYIEAGHAT